MGAIVGRRQERERIVEFLDMAGDSSRLLLIMGEAGAGKTTLLTDAIERAESLSMMVLAGAGTRLSEEVPYGALLPILRRVVGPERIDGFLGTHSVPTAALYDAAIGGCERLVTSGPALIAVEDLHWSDVATIDLLTVLSIAAIQVCSIAVTLRDDEAPAFPPRPIRL